jgi:hypothetical protein
MQRVTLVRYATKAETSDENERLARAVFDEVRANAPDRLGYALFRDGDEFIHLFVNLADESADAVTGLPSFQAYQADLASRCATPVVPVRLAVELVDSFGIG